MSPKTAIRRMLVVRGLTFELSVLPLALRLSEALGDFSKALREPNFNNGLSCYTKFSSFSV